MSKTDRAPSLQSLHQQKKETNCVYSEADTCCYEKENGVKTILFVLFFFPTSEFQLKSSQVIHRRNSNSSPQTGFRF